MGHHPVLREPQTLSREDIETLCILHAVGEQGCLAGDLAGRLGLSVTIAKEVGAALDGLVLRGLLDERAGQFSLTEVGRSRLATRGGKPRP